MNKRYNTDFYYTIDKLCIKHGITHRRLAEIVGIDEVTLSRYLTGERIMTLSAFMGICKAFNVTAEELYKSYVYSNMRQRVAKYRAEHELQTESE